MVYTSTKARLLPTTNTRPRSFALVHFKVYLSFLYEVLGPPSCALLPRSSMKTSLIRLLITFEDSGAYCFRQSTIPEVVRISKASSIMRLCPHEIGVLRRRLSDLPRATPKLPPVFLIEEVIASTPPLSCSPLLASNCRPIQHATAVVLHPPSQQPAATSPSSTARFNCTAASISSAPIWTGRTAKCAGSRRIWLWAESAPEFRRRLHAPSIWQLHKRSHGADGVSGRPKRCHGWARIRAAERMLLLTHLEYR
nr:hypothetical protein CFP56_07793 [Quercus suber]